VCKSEEEAKNLVIIKGDCGGFEDPFGHGSARAFWPKRGTADEMIHDIEVADGTTRHTKTRFFVAPGATIKLLREKEEKGYTVVYDK